MQDRKFFLLALSLENATQDQLDRLTDGVKADFKKYTRGGLITDQQALTRAINKRIDEFYNVFVEHMQESAKAVGEYRVAIAVNEIIPLLNKSGLYKEGVKLYQEIRDYGDRVAKRLLVNKWAGRPLSHTLKTAKAGTEKTIQNIITNGINESRDAFEIGKKIEQYLNPVPNVKKTAPFDEYRKRFGRPNNYTPDGMPMGTLQYNAYRIARTEMAHIAREATLDFYEDKEWVKGYSWNLSNRHPVNDVCDEYSKQTYKTRDDVPRQHPNCLCDIRPVVMNAQERKAYRESQNITEDVAQRAIKVSKQMTGVPR